MATIPDRPSLAQFEAMKARDEGALYLFRIDDERYELYRGDAKLAATLDGDFAGLNMTTVSLAGDEAHLAVYAIHKDALESFLARVVAGGYRAAVCERAK